MVEITATYKGQLRTVATHTESGVQLITDAPVDNHGKGESFSPTDLCATALINCMATIMGIKADKLGIDLTGMTLRVEKHMSKDPPRRIVALPVEIHAPASVPVDKRASLEHCCRACPVFQSLHPAIDKTIRFHWDA
ncbi:OsmC family protein [Cerasicoccus frondis]|uniref:OsmC family protein n=1 Tax=Cerasicoccus frondis TaxID=490090 RepID=UPI002852B0BE|nr:OsmC family protein [Cerasicoccus frondis]